MAYPPTDYAQLIRSGVERWNHWRHLNPEYRPNLSGIDLSHCYLFEANFKNTDLSEANLSRACLIGADLSRADLSYANLSGAYMEQANLAHASLLRTDLTATDLDNTILLGTCLEQASKTVHNVSPSNTSTINLSPSNAPENNLTKNNLIKNNPSNNTINIDPAIAYLCNKGISNQQPSPIQLTHQPQFTTHPAEQYPQPTNSVYLADWNQALLQRLENQPNVIPNTIPAAFRNSTKGTTTDKTTTDKTTHQLSN
ncbi:MAG: pentapeptide repeat-containing protein [Cyanobacteria bacterium J06614_10]